MMTKRSRRPRRSTTKTRRWRPRTTCPARTRMTPSMRRTSTTKTSTTRRRRTLRRCPWTTRPPPKRPPSCRERRRARRATSGSDRAHRILARHARLRQGACGEEHAGDPDGRGTVGAHQDLRKYRISVSGDARCFGRVKPRAARRARPDRRLSGGWSRCVARHSLGARLTDLLRGPSRPPRALACSATLALCRLRAGSPAPSARSPRSSPPARAANRR